MKMSEIKRKVRIIVSVLLPMIIVINASIPAYAVPKTMPDGTVFDAEYYAQNNPDVVAALGNSEEALYAHYVNFGKSEGRKPYGNATTSNPPAVGAQGAALNTSSAGKVTDKTIKAANKTHRYYTSIPSEYATLSDAYAKQMADLIMTDTRYTTDLQRVQAAAEMVQLMCSMSMYGTDTTKYYRSPAGLYIFGIYTCAGSTRALGRILDYMGYTWIHSNENMDKHQWCILTMDGQTGFADGMGGFAGYGAMKNGMTLLDGRVISFAE